jgi:hypothetical protein
VKVVKFKSVSPSVQSCAEFENSAAEVQTGNGIS